MRQCFGGEEIERPCICVAQHCIEHGQVVAEGFAAGCGRGDHNILPIQCRFDRARLMAVELIDAAIAQRIYQRSMNGGWHGGKAGRPRRQCLPAHHICHEFMVAAERAEKRRKSHRLG